MTLPAPPDADVPQLLRLAARDRAAARAALARLSPAQQVEVVCQAPAARRVELIELVPDPEQIVPELPVVELCTALKAKGIADAAWILEYAREEQLVACVDIDAWREYAPDLGSLEEWIEALVQAGDETLLRAYEAVDRELFILHLLLRIEVWLRESADWQPPAGALTLDGQYYYRALRPDDDLESVTRLLRVLFQTDYWLYFQALQGIHWELRSDLEEWALRWRTGRMQDLGFPPREEALAIYAHLDPEDATRLAADEGDPLDVGAWKLPIWAPPLPTSAEARLLFFRALAELDENERQAVFHAFVALVNKVAVCDDLSLGDTESIPRAIEKAADVVSSGIEHVASAHGVAATEVLRRLRLERLFRVGAGVRGLKPVPVVDTEASEEEA